MIDPYANSTCTSRRLSRCCGKPSCLFHTGSIRGLGRGLPAAVMRRAPEVAAWRTRPRWTRRAWRPVIGGVGCARVDVPPRPLQGAFEVESPDAGVGEEPVDRGDRP